MRSYVNEVLVEELEKLEDKRKRVLDLINVHKELQQHHTHEYIKISSKIDEIKKALE